MSLLEKLHEILDRRATRELDRARALDGARMLGGQARVLVEKALAPAPMEPAGKTSLDSKQPDEV